MSLKISHRAKCPWGDFHYKRDGKAPRYLAIHQWYIPIPYSQKKEISNKIQHQVNWTAD